MGTDLVYGEGSYITDTALIIMAGEYTAEQQQAIVQRVRRE